MSIGKIAQVNAKGKGVVVIEWDDGFKAEINLKPIITDHPVLAPLADPEVFQDIHLSDDAWSLEWACGIDLGSEQLYRWAREQAGEIMPAKAFRAWMQRHDMTLDAAAEALGLSRRTIAYYLSEEQVIPKTVMLATEGFDRLHAA